MQPNYNLALPFWLNSLKNPERLALVADQQLTYRELADRARAVAGWLGATPRVAILASRSTAACLSVLACAWNGATYLPLGLDWPEERLLQVLQSFRPEALLLDERGETRLTPALQEHLPARRARADLLQHPASAEPAQVDKDSLAYVIFTSGSSGQPKGVMVRCQGVRGLMARLLQDMGLDQPYRVAGNFELSFDGSILDMFPCWENGGTLYLVPRQQAMAPHTFLAGQAIQSFVLTPAHLQMMLALKAPVLPELRWCAFGADALPRDALQAWRKLAPQARLFNLYGPTEGSVAWMWHEMEELSGDWELVPLGRPLAGLEVEIAPESGELVLIGDQVAAGYWKQPELTEQRFFSLDSRPAYRTGDRVRKDPDGCFHFLGRIDNQVKIRGCRVELEEVESLLRRADPGCQAAALSWPERPGELNQLVAFVGGTRLTKAEFRQRLQASLPEFMLPSQLHILERLPSNAGGKVDRAQLRALLEP
ncbi:amino acid adenylation domain-containing protein [bacterium]|nr:amino acid adenylation domain-containing protein [bacterium]